MSELTLAASHTALIDRHDGLIFDLDGVLQLDDQPVAHAADAMSEVGRRGVTCVYLTNNAARPPEDVAARLLSLGIHVDTAQVLTSAMVAADVLADRYPPGSEILVVGGSGLVEAIDRAGLHAVTVATSDVVAVAQGWSPDIGWRLLAEGAVALRGGAAWVATNADRTLPSPRGPLPGNGSLVAALRTATGLDPEVVGKPERGMFEAAATRAGGTSPLMVGDRLDTDIAGAMAAGLPALLVLTGVASAHDLLAAAPNQRPTYVGLDLRSLLQPHHRPTVAGEVATCGSARVSADGRVTGADDPQNNAADVADALRAAAALAWAGVLPEARYDAVLEALGLA